MAEIDWSKGTITPPAQSDDIDWNSGVITPPPKPSGVIRKLADKGLGFASGAVGATKAIADAAGAGNVVSSALADTTAGIEDYLSPQAKADMQEQADIMAGAKGKGTWEGIKAGAKAFGVAPVQTAVQGLGSVVPIVAGAALSGGAVPAAVTATGIGAAMGAGTAKGAIFDEIRQRSLAAGMSETEATAAATKAQEYGGDNTDQIVLGGALGAADALTGVSAAAGRMVRGALKKPVVQTATQGAERGIVGRAVTGMAGEMPLEAAQGGQEQVAANLAAQRAGYEAGTWDNVASNATLEALASAGPGAAFGVMNRAPAKPAAPPPNDAPSNDVPAAPTDLPPTGPTVPPTTPEQAIPVEPAGQALSPEQPQGQIEEVAVEPTQTPAEAMGLDANAGPLSSAAVQAVNSGLTQSMADAAQAQAAAQEQVKNKGKEQTEGSFKTIDEARKYISTQKRADGASIQALPMPKKDGSFGVAIKGTPDYEIAAFHQKQETLRAAGVLDGDILNKAGDIFPPKHRGLAAITAKRSGVGFEAVPVAGGFVVRRAPESAKTPVSQPKKGPSSAQATQAIEDQPQAPAQQAGSVTTSGTPQNVQAQAQPLTRQDRPEAIQAPDTAGIETGGNPAPGTTPGAAAGVLEAAGVAQKTPIDEAAHAAATSPLNDLPQPTQAQKEAGNYAKGHVNVQGLDISIENPQGSTRSGKRPDGSTWEHVMSNHYGYIKRTVGADEEQVDVYVGPKPDSAKVFVVDQLDQKTGKFDEHKVMLGFTNQMQAARAYRSNFDKGWKIGPIKAMSMDEFKAWLKDGDTAKPAAQPVEPIGETGERNKSGARARGRAIDANPFKAFIAKHGISASIVGEFAPGIKERRSAMVPGYGPIFRRTGMDLDRLAQNAVEEGFLREHDVAQLSGMIHDVLRGKRHIAQYAHGAEDIEFARRSERASEIAREADQAQNAETEAEARAEREAIQDVSALSDDNPLLADGFSIAAGNNTSLADFLRAMGATEEEIANEIARQYQGQGRAGQDDQSTGRAQETSPAQAPADSGRREGQARADGEGVAEQDVGRKSDQQNAKDFEESKRLVRKASDALKDAGDRKKKAEKNSLEYGQAALDEKRAWVEISRAAVLGWPFTSGPEHQDRIDNLNEAIKSADETAEIIRREFPQGLTSPTRQDIEAQQDRAEAGARAEAKARQEVEQRAQADAERGDFTLTGSNREADQAAARGQESLFAKEPTPDYTSPYETDLFGDPVPNPAGRSGDRAQRRASQTGNVHTAATVSGDTQAPAGDYFVRTIVGTEVKRQLGTHKILTPADAAQATAYLYKSAVERLDGIVTDKAGKPLAVVGGFKGTVGQTAAYPSTLVAEAVRVPGAAHIWFSHNHPSGMAMLSRADEMLGNALTDVFHGSGIRPMGMMAIGNGEFAHRSAGDKYADGQLTRGSIPKPVAGSSVPVIERQLVDESMGAREVVDNTALAKQAASKYYQAAQTPGLILLDSQHKVSAWVPLPEQVHGPLRNTGGLNAIYRAVSESNAAAAFIVHGGELDAKGNLPGEITASQNIAAALAKIEVRPLDSINAVTMRSTAEVGLDVASGPLFAIGNTDTSALARAIGPARGMTAAAAQKVVNKIAAKWENGPRIVVVQNTNDLPAHVKARAKGNPRGIYTPDALYIVAANNRSPDWVARTLAHEAIAHHGLRGMLGAEGHNQLMKRIHAGIEAGDKLLIASRDYVRNTYAGANLSAKHEADEIAAHVVEMAVDPVSGEFKPGYGWLKMTFARIANFLRRIGFELKFTHAELHGMLVSSMKNLEVGQRTLGGGEFVVASARRDTLQATNEPTAPESGGAPDILMALGTPTGASAFANAAVDRINSMISAPGKVSWWHKSLGTMYNLAERAPAFKPVFEAAQNFINDVSFYATEAADLAPQILPKLETWADIKKSPISAADNKAVSAPIFEGTLSWARDESGKAVRIESLEAEAAKLTPHQKAQRLLRNDKVSEQVLKMWRGLPVDQFNAIIETKFKNDMLKPGVVFTDAELKSIFNLTPEQITLYREFRTATDKSLDNLAKADMLRYGGEDVKALRDDVMAADDADAAGLLLRDYLLSLAKEDQDRSEVLTTTASGMIDRADKVQALKKEGYAPLSRFGQYTVDVVVDGERQYFSLFESAHAANAMANKMRMLYGKDAVTQGTLSNEAFKLFAGITPESLELFGNMLGLDSTGDQARDKVFQDYLKLTKTNRSAMRRLIHRKGIAGYSEDAGRVLAGFIYSNARQTSAALHMGDLGEAITEIPKQQGELTDVAVKLSDYIKNPQEEAHAVRGLLFAQYLGGSIASAAVNMTQPFAVSMPYLSQFGGIMQSGRELARAYRDMAKKEAGFEPDLAAALRHAEETGIVSPQEVHQLMAQARGSGSLKSGDGTRAGNALAMGGNALSRLSLAWGKVFGMAEQLNRRTTFIAAYRIAKAQGIKNPTGFAEKAVNETQFVYNKANKMQFGRGAVGGTLMTFKTYSISYLELMHRMYTQGGPEGKKAALLGIAVLMLMSGAGGLPFAEDAEDLVDGALQRMGYNVSSKKARQEFLESIFGRAGAEFIDRGITGLPGVPLDVSGRLGMGNLIPGTGVFTEKRSHAGDIGEVVGPLGDFVKRLYEGGGQLLSGDIGKAALTVSPTAVRNVAKGVDMADSGMYRDAKGYKVLDTTGTEAAFKAIGFQPATVAQVQDASHLTQKAKDFYNMTAQDIRARWAKGIFEKDRDQVAQARAMLDAWNRNNPEQHMSANVPAILKKAREMGKSKEQRIADTAPKAMRMQLRQDIEQRHAQ